MTDHAKWDELIHVANLQWTDFRGEPAFREYVMIPLKPYQMGNLIDAIAQVAETGDWYGEFCDIIAVAMRKLGLTELTSNRNKSYTYEQIRGRLGTRPPGFVGR